MTAAQVGGLIAHIGDDGVTHVFDLNARGVFRSVPESLSFVVG
jgi:hypothetical protein